MLFDSHCHIHFNAYKEDMDEVIKRTLEQGVFMITVGTQKDTSRIGLEVAEKHDGMWATVGIHPNHLTKQSFFDDDELPDEDQPNPKIQTRTEAFDFDYYQDLAKHPKCVAIGECGLDYYRIPEDQDQDEVKELQKKTVRAHFDLADETNLPVIIHCRDAYKDQLEIVKGYVEAGKLKAKGVVHCFGGTLEDANEFIKMGFYIGFTGVVTFPARKKDELFDGLPEIQHIAKTIPLENIFVETDAPYLTPVPHRGERNEPAFVKFVAEKVAELRGVSVEEIENATTENVKRLFKI
jgi:TatD DNase family protein